MPRRGRLIVFVAPSGAGKTSVIRLVRSRHGGVAYSVSCTTRPMRPGEVDGRDYRFLDEPTFRRGIDDGRFVEWAEVHGHLYGTPREPLDEALEQDRDVLLDLDVAGSLRLKELYRDRAVTVFLSPPSVDELERRLLGRATDSPEVQRLRLRNALKEMTFRDRFDFQVVNDDLERVCREIDGILGFAPRGEGRGKQQDEGAGRS
ncbi:MAG: guanylate kinase [Deltaproteobacteria bacterium]|nr:guanylate kinase [Deltaproteobacteria bacterium]